MLRMLSGSPDGCGDDLHEVCEIGNPTEKIDSTRAADHHRMHSVKDRKPFIAYFQGSAGEIA